ncbi:MAG: MFS transporter [Candidatus Delongbacteria bacterium]|nr:MFS transporter [Candidatus Delongbacteria bacterium]
MLNDLTKIQKKIVSVILISTLFNAVLIGLGPLMDIIATKALGAADWQLTLLVMIWPVTNFVSIWWGKILESSENKSIFYWIVAFFGRLIFVLGIWVMTMNQFLVLLAVSFSFNSLFIPLYNNLFQKHFDSKIRGKIFGLTISLSTLIVIIFSYIAGRILDSDENSFRIIMVFAGISGFLGTAILSTFKPEIKTKNHVKKFNFHRIFISPLSRTWETLKKNKDFRNFEINFTIYGFGFIMVLPSIPIYLIEHLEMTYTSSFIAKAIIAQIGLLLLSPLFGKIHGKWHPHYFTAISFLTFSMFPLTLYISTFTSADVAIILVFAAYFIYSFGMAGVNITWNISSIFFAGKEDSSMYQSIHVSATGIRGLLAPLLGLFIYRIFGVELVFLVSFLFIFTGSIMSYRSYLKRSRK